MIPRTATSTLQRLTRGFPDAMHKWQKFTSDARLPPVIVYGGEGNYERQGCRVMGWRELQGYESHMTRDITNAKTAIKNALNAL